MKKIVVFCLLIVSVFLSVSCAFADGGFGGGSRGGTFGSSGFSTGTTSTVISYDALSDLCLELNDRLASGNLGAELKTVSCNIEVYRTVAGRDMYAIVYHYQSVNYWYCNASGGLVYAYKDIDLISDALGGNNGGIAYYLNRMEYVLTGSLLTAVNSINTTVTSLLTTCNTISTKLDTLTSMISNGKVLVDNSDVVTAINNIPTYDDTEIAGYVGSITEWLDWFSRKYDGTYTNMYEKIASISDALGTVNKHFVTANRNTAEIIDTLTATVDEGTGKLLVEDSALISAIQASAYDDTLLEAGLTAGLSTTLNEVQSLFFAFDDGTLDSSSRFATLTGILALQVYGQRYLVNLVTSSSRQEDRLVEIRNRLTSLVDKPVTDYTAQLTAVTNRMDDILAQLQSTSGSATCEHTYSQHMEQEANCILPGLMISTCSKCGDSSSEIVDPLGHDWQCTEHVDAVTDPDTGEETSSAYDIYTCSRCGDTCKDHTGTGAPDEDYSNTTISQLVVKVFSKLGTFAGKLLGSVVHLFDKAVTAVDDLATKFNDYVEQIKGFGENYPIWLSGFWGIIPAELQVALTFAVICMALGVVGRKLFFS